MTRLDPSLRCCAWCSRQWWRWLTVWVTGVMKMVILPGDEHRKN